MSKTTVAIRPEYRQLAAYLVDMHKLTNSGASTGGLVEELILAYATQSATAVFNPEWRSKLIELINICEDERAQRSDGRTTRHA